MKTGLPGVETVLVHGITDHSFKAEAIGGLGLSPSPLFLNALFLFR